jgi:hypothetical protein
MQFSEPYLVYHDTVVLVMLVMVVVLRVGLVPDGLRLGAGADWIEGASFPHLRVVDAADTSRCRGDGWSYLRGRVTVFCGRVIRIVIYRTSTA